MTAQLPAETSGAPELLDEEDSYCVHGVHCSVECEKCQDEVDEELYREERGLDLGFDNERSERQGDLIAMFRAEY